VVFTYNGLRTEETANTLYTSATTYIDSVEALDDYTVVFKMATPNPGGIRVFYPDFFIIPKHLMENVAFIDWRTSDLANKKPIGTGPFKFVEWEHQQFIKMEANDNYYLGRPVVDERISINIPDPSTALAAIQKGDVDILSPRFSFEEKQLEELSGDANIKIYYYLSKNPIMMGVNHAHPLLTNKYVVKAISAAIPRERIATDVMAGNGVAATSYLNEISWSWNPDIQIPKYDIEQAKAYMEMAGYDFEWLEPPPTTPLSEFLLYAVAGLIVGLVIGVATRFIWK
jgi:peptide/nickel transport system substrate-binding protein